MIINILETKFEATKIKEGQLLCDPTDDMHHIEAMEAQLDRSGGPYALVECRSEPRGRRAKAKNSRSKFNNTLDRSTFLGWSIAVPKASLKDRVEVLIKDVKGRDDGEMPLAAGYSVPEDTYEWEEV